MMFKYKKISSSVIIFLFTLISVLTAIQSNGLSKLNFDNLKNRFISETSSFKLQNYLKKLKLKKLGIIDETKGQKFIFVDSGDKDRMIFNNIRDEDINFDKMADQKDLDEFKARIFSYIFKNKDANKSDGLYLPNGINFDDEKITGWKIYLVLMNSMKNEKHKLIKVCLRENSPHDNFALIMNFDSSSKEIINFMKEKGILSDNNPEYSKQIRILQSKLINDQLKKKLEKTKNFNFNNSNFNRKNTNSFIEKSSATVAVEKSKTFSMESLANKFSVEELAKIKALIKFAKTNKILDDIYMKKGDVKVEDLVNSKFPYSYLVNNSSSVTSSNITSYNFSSIPTKIKKEIDELKSIIQIQNNKLEENYHEIKQNVNNMKDMVIFVKELSGEFHKSMLAFGDGLKQINSELEEQRKNNLNIHQNAFGLQHKSLLLRPRETFDHFKYNKQLLKNSDMKNSAYKSSGINKFLSTNNKVGDKSLSNVIHKEESNLKPTVSKNNDKLSLENIIDVSLTELSANSKTSTPLSHSSSNESSIFDPKSSKIPSNNKIDTVNPKNNNLPKNEINNLSSISTKPDSSSPKSIKKSSSPFLNSSMFDYTQDDDKLENTLNSSKSGDKIELNDFDENFIYP